MTHENEDRRPAANGTAIQEQAGQPNRSVTDRRAAERSRRSRRWARRNLDDLLLHEPPSSITTADVLSLTVAPAWLRDTGCVRLHDGDCDYWGHCTGMNLGHPERRAAGIALRERGWVA